MEGLSHKNFPESVTFENLKYLTLSLCYFIIL